MNRWLLLAILLAGNAFAQKISEFPNTPGPLNGGEYMPCIETNASVVGNYKCSSAQIASLALLSVNVVSQGADPTGVTYSTAAINAAASVQQNGNYLDVYFPTGTYLINGPIIKHAGQCFYGDGFTQTALYVDPTFQTGQQGIIVQNTAGPFGFNCWRAMQVHGQQPQPVSTNSNAFQGAGQTSITVVNATNFTNKIGWYISDFTLQNVIPPGTTITSVVGNTINMSNAITGGGVGNGDSIQAHVTRAKILPLGQCDGVTTGCQYPPVFYDALPGDRPLIRDILMWGCWDGIILPQNVAPNIENVKSGCVDIGLQIGDLTDGTKGPKDFSYVHAWESWNGWGWTSGSATFASGASAWDDGATRCMEIGRVDGLNIAQVGCVMSLVHLNAAHSSSVSTSEFANFMMDGTTSFITIDGGLHDEFVNIYLGGSDRGYDAQGSICPLNVTGGYASFVNSRHSTNPTLDTTSNVCVSGGTLKMDDDRFIANNLTLSPIVQTGGTLIASHIRFTYPSNTTLTVPIFASTGGTYSFFDNTATGLLGGISVSSTSDNAGNRISGNTFPGTSISAPNVNQLGFYSLEAPQNTPGNDETSFGIGYGALDTFPCNAVSGSCTNYALHDTAVGTGALTAALTTTASNDTAVGHNALTALTSGTQNTAVGNQALAAITTQANNVAVGHSALGLATGGTNTAVGAVALGVQTSGAANVAVGYQAADTLTNGSNNTVIGTQCNTSSATANNEIDVCGGAGNGTILQCTGTNVPGTTLCGFSGALLHGVTVVCSNAGSNTAGTPLFTHTGGTTEANLVNCAIPASILQPGGSVRVTSLWYRNAATTNTVTYTVRPGTQGSVAGFQALSITYAISGGVMLQTGVQMWSIDSTHQLIPQGGALTNGTPYGSGTSNPVVGTINTGNTWYMNFNCADTTAGTDTCGIYSYLVEVINP